MLQSADRHVIRFVVSEDLKRKEIKDKSTFANKGQKKNEKRGEKNA